MVAVQVRDKNMRDAGKLDLVPAQLYLGALAAIDQEHVVAHFEYL